jgi:hypothetical protein
MHHDQFQTALRHLVESPSAAVRPEAVQHHKRFWEKQEAACKRDTGVGLAQLESFGAIWWEDQVSARFAFFASPW